MTHFSIEKRIIFLIVMFQCLIVSAQERSEPFERIYVFGASISARYSGYWDGFNSILFGKLGQQDGPADWLAKQYSSNHQVYINVARADTPGRIEIEHELKQPSPRFLNATSYISVDGLAKDAQTGKCEESLLFINQLIEFGQRWKKPVVLGNLPDVKPDHVDPELKQLGWRPFDPQCMNRINSLLSRVCTPKSFCYLLDLKAIYSEIESETLIYEGKVVQAKDVTFDGLHLTDLGAEILGRRIEKMISNSF